MARTRFDEKPAQPVGHYKTGENGDVDQVDLLVSAVNNRNKNPHTVKYIDPSMDPRYAIHRIQLPAKTMYLIDKVVRAKALQGPIGVNNSEVINLEQERELRKKNIYYANLAEKKPQTDDGQESDEDYGM